jgi:tRNA-2-methylthio-N6-dimethylallyladenosine synthase
MADSIIEAMAACDEVCPQLHLPLQSGSDSILDRMERGHTVDEYLRLVERLRTAVPDLALSTDVIVGFPGETERDFEATAQLMRFVRYDHAFMFKYSRREFTRAAVWEDTVSEAEKGRRLQEVILLQEQIAAEINAGTVGQDVEVLVEGPARRGRGWLAGKNRQFKTTVFPAADTHVGELVNVRVQETTAHTLIGELAG